MTVTATNRKEQFTANGVTTEFTFTFAITDTSQVYAYTVLDGVETEYTDFTVVASDDVEGGTLTTNSVLSGVDLLIYRDVALTQQVDYESGGRFPADSHEQALDKLTLQNQDQEEELGRAVKVDISQNEVYTIGKLEDGKFLTLNGSTIESSSDTEIQDIINELIKTAIAASTRSDAIAFEDGVYDYTISGFNASVSSYYIYHPEGSFNTQILIPDLDYTYDSEDTETITLSSSWSGGYLIARVLDPEGSGTYTPPGQYTSSELVSKTGLQDDTEITVSDLGYAKFIISDTVSANAWDIQLNSGQVAVLRLDNGPLRPAWFGATGGSDEYNELSLMFSASDGLVIDLGAQGYYSSKAISQEYLKGCEVRGTLASASITFDTPTDAGLLLNVATGTTDSETSFHIHDFSILCSNGSDKYGLTINGSLIDDANFWNKGSTVERMYIQGSNTDTSLAWFGGLKIDSVGGLTVNKLISRGVIKAGQTMEGYGIHVTGNCTEAPKITNCELVRYYACVYLQLTIDDGSGIEGCSVGPNNTFLASSYGFIYEPQEGATSGDPGFYIRGNHFNTYIGAIQTNYCNQLTFSDNLVYAGVLDRDIPYIGMDVNNSVTFTAHNNQWSSSQNDESTIGILTDVDYISIHGNVAQGASITDGIVLEGGCNYFDYRGNNFPLLSGSEFINNSTATNYNFVGANAGSTVEVRFAVTALPAATSTQLNILPDTLKTTCGFTASSAGVITVPKGVYNVSVAGVIMFDDAGSTGSRQMTVRLNGNEVLGGFDYEADAGESSRTIVKSSVMSLDVEEGDLLTFQAYQNSGGSLNTVSSLGGSAVTLLVNR